MAALASAPNAEAGTAPIRASAGRPKRARRDASSRCSLPTREHRRRVSRRELRTPPKAGLGATDGRSLGPSTRTANPSSARARRAPCPAARRRAPRSARAGRSSSSRGRAATRGDRRAPSPASAIADLRPRPFADERRARRYCEHRAHCDLVGRRAHHVPECHGTHCPTSCRGRGWAFTRIRIGGRRHVTRASSHRGDVSMRRRDVGVLRFSGPETGRAIRLPHLNSQTQESSTG